MLMHKLYKNKICEVRSILNKILNYFEYIYFCSYEKQDDIKYIKDLVEKTKLSKSYLTMNVKRSSGIYSYVSFEEECIYITKEDILSSDFEFKVINICITEFLKKALDYVKEDNIRDKYIVFYTCLLNLKFIPNSYKDILEETDIIALYIAENIFNY